MGRRGRLHMHDVGFAQFMVDRNYETSLMYSADNPRHDLDLGRSLPTNNLTAHDQFIGDSMILPSKLLLLWRSLSSFKLAMHVDVRTRNLFNFRETSRQIAVCMKTLT
jgi:hypothetical protein